MFSYCAGGLMPHLHPQWAYIWFKSFFFQRFIPLFVYQYTFGSCFFSDTYALGSLTLMIFLYFVICFVICLRGTFFWRFPSGRNHSTLVIYPRPPLPVLCRLITQLFPGFHLNPFWKFVWLICNCIPTSLVVGYALLGLFLDLPLFLIE